MPKALITIVRLYYQASRVSSDTVKISHTEGQTLNNHQNTLEDRVDEEGKEANVAVFGFVIQTYLPKFTAKRIGESRQVDKKAPSFFFSLSVACQKIQLVSELLAAQPRH